MRAQISLSNRELENRSLDTASVEQAARLFSQHGALFIKNVFQRDLIQKLRDAFLQEYANRPDDEIRKTCLEVGDKRFMFTIAIRSPFNDPDLYASPLLLPILRTLVGSECILQSVGIVCAYPGSEMQHLHADHPPLFEEAVGLSAFFPPYALHVVVPLVDLNEECGTTALWEGSHRIKSPGDEKRCSAQATDTLQGASFPWPKMGDCYLMDYRLRHRGTPNRSNRPRPILYLIFSRPWFQDRRNYTIQPRLVMDPPEYEKIPEEHRVLFETMRPVGPAHRQDGPDITVPVAQT